MAASAKKKPVAKPVVMLTKEQIVAADDRPIEDVEMPEWGGWVKVRKLSLDQYIALNDSSTNPFEAMLKVVQCGVIEPVLDDNVIALMREKDADAIIRLAGVISNLSGITEADRQTAVRQFPNE